MCILFSRTRFFTFINVTLFSTFPLSTISTFHKHFSFSQKIDTQKFVIFFSVTFLMSSSYRERNWWRIRAANNDVNGSNDVDVRQSYDNEQQTDEKYSKTEDISSFSGLLTRTRTFASNDNGLRKRNIDVE